MSSEVHEKDTEHTPLTGARKASNRQKSRIRARVEHAFGYMTKSALLIRTLGYTRATAKTRLANLTYNLMRCVQLKKRVRNVFFMG